MSLEGRSPEDVQALAELAEALATNPNTRHGFLGLTKKINPGANIPEIDIPASLQASMAPQLDRLKQLEEAQAKRDMEDRVREARAAALKVKGVSDDDMPAIEKLMLEKRIPDHATAAEFLAATRRSAEPTPHMTRPRMPADVIPKLPDLKEFGGNLQDYARQQAYAAIDELRGRRA